MSTLIIGITGGIGSGKTTVTDYFASLGVTVVDADQAARVVIEPGTPALQTMVDHFGEQVLQADGYLNRRALRHIIFNDPKERRWLEALLHPLIREKITIQLLPSESPYHILASPLLLETDQHTMVDRVVVVDISVELQVQRTMVRDRIEQSKVEAILKAQTDRDTRLAKADDVIENSGSLEVLYQTLDQLHETWLTLAADKQGSTT